MHDQRVFLGGGQLVVVEAEELKILADRRNEIALHPLHLEAQHHHDVAAFEAGLHVMEHLDAVALHIGGQQGPGPDHPHPGPHGGEQKQVRPGDPGVQHVAADGDGQPLEAPEAPADGQRIQQRLGRVFVAAVAGVDDGAVHLFREQLDGARFAVPDHQHIRVHGIQRHRRVDQAFALVHRTGRHRHVEDVGAEPLSGKLERRAGPGRGFEEQVDDGSAAQRVALLLGLAVQFDIRVGRVEQNSDLIGGKAFDTEQVAVGKCCGNRWIGHKGGL